MIFAVFDVLVTAAVNTCINCSFVHLYLQFYYSLMTLIFYNEYQNFGVLTKFRCFFAIF